MDRRKFLKNLGVLLAATQLPPAFLGDRKLAVTEVAFPARHTTFSLGFTVTREMIDDDIYGEPVRKMLANGWTKHFQFETESYLLKKHYTEDI